MKKYKHINIMTGEFWSDGVMGGLYLDRWIYRGKGRPRKEDYSTLAVLQKKINNERAKEIDRQLFN